MTRKRPPAPGRRPADVKQRRGPGRPARPLSRPEVIQAALAVAHRHGVEKLTLNAVAKELGITPTAVLWYVRSKKELVEAVIDVALRHLAPPKRGSGPWTEELIRIFTALRHEMLANRRLLHTTGFGRGAPLAFARVALASTRILIDAGFAPEDVPRASQTLIRHTAGLAAVEMAVDAASGVPGMRAFGLRQAAAKLSPAELRLFKATILDPASMDADEAFAHGLRCLVRGLELTLQRGARRRRVPRGGSPPHAPKARTRATTRRTRS